MTQRTRNTYGNRCFAAARRQVWNSLTAELRQCDSLEKFKQRLKTYFSGYGTTGLSDCSEVAPYRNILT